MKIKSIKIEKLFELFDYDIPLENEEGLLILTGPNGYGKTMILNIIYNLFSGSFLFFSKLVFSSILVKLEGDVEIYISKQESRGLETAIEVFERENRIELINPFNFFLENIGDLLDVYPRGQNTWFIKDENRIATHLEVIKLLEINYPDYTLENLGFAATDKAKPILDSIKTHFITEQRLFRIVTSPDLKTSEDKHSTMTGALAYHAENLRLLLKEYFSFLFHVSSDLDSSYPHRLINEKTTISELDFFAKVERISKKQEHLKKYGLYKNNQKPLYFSEPDAKALLLYLNDLEAKLDVFDDLVVKLDLFTHILNDNILNFKTIVIDESFGFAFKDTIGKILDPTKLSSGEQQEIILYYELIFNTKPDTLVLIDEPEISLHVAWQREFIGDLIKIISLQKAQAIVATHSPSIIADRWDLVYNLEKVIA